MIVGKDASEVCASAPPPPFVYITYAVSKLSGVGDIS